MIEILSMNKKNDHLDMIEHLSGTNEPIRICLSKSTLGVLICLFIFMWTWFKQYANIFTLDY
jgi:hypothetical protein